MRDRHEQGRRSDRRGGDRDRRPLRALLGLRALAARSPADPRKLRAQVRLLRGAGLGAEARRLLEAALARDPRSTALLLLAGENDLLAGRLARARERFEKILRAEPDHPEARLHLAVADHVSRRQERSASSLDS